MKEEDLKHGAKRQNRILTKTKRALRPKHNKIGMASVPFDWTVGYERNNAIDNQGQTEGCGGGAGSKWLQNYVTKGKVSMKGVYSQGFYHPSGGMSEVSLKDVICNKPILLESQVPSYDAAGNPLSESMLRDTSWRGQIIPLPPLGFVPVTVGIDKESIAQAIRDTGGVIMLVEGQNGNPRSWLSICPQPPVKSNPSAIWAHWMCYTGVRVNYPKPLRADQSWGITIGDQGRQYFDEEYLSSGYITDCFTFVPKAQFQDPRIPILQKMLQLYQQLLAALQKG